MVVIVFVVVSPDQELPLLAVIPLNEPEKAPGVAVPPLLLTTCLMIVSVGGVSLLVMVHIAFPPFVIVPEHPELRLLL